MTTRRSFLGALAALVAAPKALESAVAKPPAIEDLIPHIPETGIETFAGGKHSKSALELLARDQIGGCRLIPEIKGFPCYLERMVDRRKVVGTVLHVSGGLDYEGGVAFVEDGGYEAFPNSPRFQEYEGRFSATIPDFKNRKYGMNDFAVMESWKRQLTYQYLKKVEAIRKQVRRDRGN